MEVILFILAFFVLLGLVVLAVKLCVAMVFARHEYAVFKEYRINNNRKYNWFIFMNHMFGGLDYDYNRVREEAFKDSGYKWQLKRISFNLLVALIVVFIMISMTLVYISV